MMIMTGKLSACMIVSILLLFAEYTESKSTSLVKGLKSDRQQHQYRRKLKGDDDSSKSSSKSEKKDSSPKAPTFFEIVDRPPASSPTTASCSKAGKKKSSKSDSSSALFGAESTCDCPVMKKCSKKKKKTKETCDKECTEKATKRKLALATAPAATPVMAPKQMQASSANNHMHQDDRTLSNTSGSASKSYTRAGSLFVSGLIGLVLLSNSMLF